LFFALNAQLSAHLLEKAFAVVLTKAELLTLNSAKRSSAIRSGVINDKWAQLRIRRMRNLKYEHLQSAANLSSKRLERVRAAVSDVRA